MRGAKSENIRALLAEGKTVAEVSRETKSHYSFVYSIKQRMVSSKPANKPRGITVRKLSAEKDPTTPEPRAPQPTPSLHAFQAEQRKRRERHAANKVESSKNGVTPSTNSRPSAAPLAED